jgi:hypothetical protein
VPENFPYFPALREASLDGTAFVFVLFSRLADFGGVYL